MLDVIVEDAADTFRMNGPSSRSGCCWREEPRRKRNASNFDVGKHDEQIGRRREREGNNTREWKTNLAS
jgi:hypothetical protein